jgi:hypothetical protein
MAIPLFFGSLAAGAYGFREAKPWQLLYLWDAVAVGFVATWCIGVLTELQRTDNLSISKFLHLPVSVQGIFLINYISSLVCLTTVIFVPLMFGLTIGLAFAQGARMLVVFPPLLAFLLMITALTYQFQGWLASLMSNPRRRRAVIVGATMAFVLIFQLPNLLNILRPWSQPQQADQATALQQKLNELQKALQERKIDVTEFARLQQQAIEEDQRKTVQAWRNRLEDWDRMGRLMNLAVPIGWLPFGVMEAADGRLAPAALATLAMTLIGAGSLWRAYRTTMRLYQGQFTASQGRRTAVSGAGAVTTAGASNQSRWRLLETHLPWISEPAAAVALASIRSLLRAPEVKMMALTPLIMVVIGAVGLRQADSMPALIRPLIAVGAMVIVLVTWMQLLANQFAFDRDGFRVFVLCGASRRDILLGKNLAVALLALAVSGILLIVFQIV